MNSVTMRQSSKIVANTADGGIYAQRNRAQILLVSDDGKGVCTSVEQTGLTSIGAPHAPISSPIPQSNTAILPTINRADDSTHDLDQWRHANV